MDPQQDSNIGNQLKEEREKQGLSREQVSEVTKIRIHIIEALENEEWSSLPSSVFVKGFIRSYAQVLGLDWNRAVALYKTIAPSENVVPKPLVKADVVKKQHSLFFLTVLAILAVIIVLWVSYYKDASIKKGAVPADRETEAEMEHIQEERGNISNMKAKSFQAPPPEDQMDGVPPQNELAPAGKEAATVAVPSNDNTEAEETTDSIVEAVIAGGEIMLDSGVTSMHVLKGIVSMETWLKIYIDNKPAKEYMFKPGSMPQWEASTGFDLLVGNAAGIVFDFDGNRSIVSGGTGRVRRVGFPEDFESNFYEE